MGPDINKILEGLGFQPGALSNVKLGRGVVGKITYIAGAVFAVLAILAIRDPNTWSMMAILGAVVVLFLTFLFSVLKFAAANPSQALLEGAELLQWHKMNMSAKGQLPILDTEVTTDPTQAAVPNLLTAPGTDAEEGTA